MGRRFLLDQNFPPLPVVPADIDATVDYVPLIDFDARLAEKQTPDWLIILSAASGGFDGMVTRDATQLEQVEELLAATRTDLSIVTWRKQIDDPIEVWGHLIAYMPHIQRRIGQDGPRLFVLPKPSLQNQNVLKASGELGRLATEQRRSTREVTPRGDRLHGGGVRAAWTQRARWSSGGLTVTVPDPRTEARIESRPLTRKGSGVKVAVIGNPV